MVAKDEEGAQIVPGEVEAAKAEIRRLQRELADVGEEREILKKRGSSSHEKTKEVPLHRGARQRVLGRADVQGVGSTPCRVLHLVQATAHHQRVGQCGTAGENPGCV